MQLPLVHLMLLDVYWSYCGIWAEKMLQTIEGAFSADFVFFSICCVKKIL